MVPARNVGGGARAAEAAAGRRIWVVDPGGSVGVRCVCVGGGAARGVYAQ